MCTGSLGSSSVCLPCDFFLSDLVIFKPITNVGSWERHHVLLTHNRTNWSTLTAMNCVLCSPISLCLISYVPKWRSMPLKKPLKNNLIVHTTRHKDETFAVLVPEVKLGNHFDMIVYTVPCVSESNFVNGLYSYLQHKSAFIHSHTDVGCRSHRSRFGFSFLPKDTLTARQRGLGTKPLTFNRWTTALPPDFWLINIIYSRGYILYFLGDSLGLAKWAHCHSLL